MYVVVVEVASVVGGTAGLSCSVLVPSSCGARSSCKVVVDVYLQVRVVFSKFF